MNTKKLLALVAVIVATTCGAWADSATTLLMPKPHQITENGATFDLTQAVSISDPTGSTLLASLFPNQSDAAAVSVGVNLVDAASLGTFDYNLAGFPNEGYKLEVTAGGITIQAASKTGVIRAAQTLMQLAAANGGNSIPGVSITDWAAFKLRGYMHDVGRSFVSFDELKKEVDLLSRFKVNVFHWHMTDNQGFRFESKTYPQLNAASAMTRFAGSYYTQAQCTELEAYAAERGMIIIPEIDMPGHSQAFQTAMGFAMNSDDGIPVLKTLLSELATAFPLAPYIHIGCDEAGTTAAFVNEMSQYVKETLQRKCLVWNPISGVTINTTNLPYIDMTEMWGTSGRLISGLPNIDCRYNYINHFDVFADLVGIYKSNIYYAQQGSAEVAGAISGLWNDRKTPTETDIIRQNNLWANAIATAERGWMGGGQQYIETGGTTLPNSGSEFEEFADWERRFLYYKGTWLKDESIPYVKQTNVRWRITQPFPNGGTASTVFPPEESTADVLPDEFTYDGQTYTTSMATGGGIYLRHTWGTTVPAFFSSPQLNTTAYAWTYVYSPVAQTAGALIEFQNYSRSENDRAPDNGSWDRKGSRIWVNGTEVAPPTWGNAGKSIGSEVDLQNENFTARDPMPVSLNAGWNKVFIKLPYVSAGGIRLNKWMFTFVLTDASGNNALEGISYSPIQSLDANIDGVVTTIGDIKTYVNSKCGTAVGVYPRSAASSLLAEVETVEATLQETLTAAERKAQVDNLTSAFDTFKTSLSSAAINQPTAYTSAEPHYYTLCTPQRGTRYVTSSGAGAELGGHPTLSAEGCWKFVSCGDGTWNIVNVVDASYIAPNSTNNTALSTSATQPSAGWTIGKAATDGYVTITSGSCQFNQTNSTSSVLSGGYRLYNWGGGTNTTDTGCQYLIAEIDEDDIPFTLSTTALDEFADKAISVSATAATELATWQWYIMKNMGRNSYLYEKASDHKLYTQSTQPTGEADGNAQFLVRLIDDGNGGYYLQTGYGNYFYTLVDGNDGSGVGGNNNGTKAFMKTAYTIGTIASGYFWLKDANGVVMDANTAGSTVAGWGTTTPTSTSSNAAWQFFPVTLTDAWKPTAAQVYTLNNTNTNRGALVYDGTSTNVGLVASGSLDATNPNHQWVVYPTETEGEYYLFNVGAGKFAIPTAIAQSNQNAWVFSYNAVAVTLTSETAGTYRIKMAKDPVSGTNAAVLGVNRNLNPAVFNYNDAGSDFTFTRVEGADASAAATAAVSKLIISQTALATYPQASGWYAIQIKSKNGAASYAGRFMQNATSLYNSLYPLTFTGAIDVQPSVTDPTFFTYISHTSWDVNTWQLPDGRYLVNNGSNKFPTPSMTPGNVLCGYSNGNYFKEANNYYADPYNSNANYYIGETTSMRTAYNVYAIDLDAAGLDAWKVTVTNGSESTPLTCTRSDVRGLTAVYPGGYFFLPTGVTPSASDFAMEGMVGDPVIDSENKTVTATYDPSISFLPSNVTVGQGNQTTGQGNTRAALLRVKVTPFAACTPTSVTISLSGADQIDRVAIYQTAGDQLHADDANPVELGSADVPSASPAADVPSASPEGLTISLTAATELAAATPAYLWVAADVKAGATELASIDAAITAIAYSNDNGGNTCDLTATGNPDGAMRIFKRQAALWTGTFSQTRYYRIPTILRTADGGIAAFADYRYDNTEDLGKPASGHKIDVVMRKSTDDGATWAASQTIAAGDGATAAAYGYGDPAVVRTASGKLICLMAAGQNSYPTGMLHTGYTESTDNGATWTAPKDIYADINTNGITFQSAFVTAGKGVTFANGRVAFAMNGKVDGTTNEYVIYSDDEGATWNVVPTPAFTGADESKLEIMNDGSLLMSIRRGGWNTMANRGYNRTTGDASADGINTWGTQGIWGNEMNANGCNADILYYNRSTDDASRPDVILHTLTKTFSTYRRDLRLYMSFDQGQTWLEAFSLQPGFAAYSSMQKLANGDLAIIYEDGSIGNQDKMDCYAMNYIVLSAETLNARIDELYEESFSTTAGIITQGETDTAAPFVSWTPASGWATSFTTTATSGLAGVTVSANYSAFNRQGGYDQRVLLFRPSAAGASDVYTITAPDGYLLDGYTIGGYFGTSSQTYTLTAEDGTSVAINKNKAQQNPPTYLTVSGLNKKSTTLTFSNSNTAADNYAFITHFTVRLVRATTYTRTVTPERWGTVCVPGAVAAANIIGADIYRIAGKKLGADGKPAWLELEEVDAMLAGVPYLFQATAATLSLTYPESSAVTTAGSDNGLIGSFAATPVDEGMYLLSNNTIVLCGTGCSIAANRAYINMNEVPKATEAGAKSISVYLNPSTGITATDDAQPTTPAAIYNIAGQRLARPQRGVNIIGGRKVVVK